LVAINFSVWGFEYESGVGAVEQMYLTAHENLWGQRERCYRDLEAIERGEFVGKLGEGNEIYSHEKLVGFELANIELSIQLLRQSTLLMAYHFWEKQVLRWTEGAHEKPRNQSLHDSYIAYCLGRGMDVDQVGLETLRLISNVVKHGQGERAWADKLFESRPDLFSDAVTVSADPYELLKLSHELVFEMMSVLTASGPKAFSNFAPKVLT
jgi:hypothetical protein